MRSSRREFVTQVVGATAGVALFGEYGCSRSNAAVADVVYEGVATEDAVVALLDAQVIENPMEAATFTWTSNGDMFSASMPLTFCWTSLAGVGSTTSTKGEPLTGKAYLLVLSTDKNPKLLRVFTTNSDHTASADTMAKLSAAGGPIRAVVTTAYFTEDAIKKAGGPFAGNAVTFMVAP